MIRKVSMKALLKEIIELRDKGDVGLNDEVYTHIKPGQDVVYVRQMSELIRTYLWILDK